MKIFKTIFLTSILVQLLGCKGFNDLADGAAQLGSVLASPTPSPSPSASPGSGVSPNPIVIGPTPTANPTVSPLPSPTPTPVPDCFTAGPYVERAPDEFAVTLQAANNKFVVAECGGDDVGTMHANRGSTGEWEMFYVLPQPGGKVSIRSSHGRNLSAESGGGNAVVANRKAVLSWEAFQLVGSLLEGATISLKTSDNLHYVSARIDQTLSPVDASVTTIGLWEQFKLHIVKSPHLDPMSFSSAQLRDFQGDLMLWVPVLKPNFVNGEDPVTHIRHVGDNNMVAKGIEAGWIWTLSISRYPSDQREIIYKAALEQGNTHFAVQVTKCTNERGYHGLYPTTAADCATADDKLNTILHELWDHKLIPLCAGVSPTDPVAPGLDKSLCRVVMNDWDNSSQADCRIKVLSQTFPDALILYELPGGDLKPTSDSCSPSPFPASGGEWIRVTQQKYPGFFAVAYETDMDKTVDQNVAQINGAHSWWRDVQEVRFETDTYWKFWFNYDFAIQKKYNDDLQTRVPFLKGFMSGGTTHAPPSNNQTQGGYIGELESKGVSFHSMAPDFANWPITTHIKRVDIKFTGLHLELDNGKPESWPNTAARPDMGELLYSYGIVELINGVWHASAPIQLWRGLKESGGPIQIQDVGDGTGRGQIQANWYYDSHRWGVLAGYQPKPSETIGVFVCAGDCRDGVGSYSPVHERSNIVLIALPKANEEVIISVP